jgi:SsrA-binding protein
VTTESRLHNEHATDQRLCETARTAIATALPEPFITIGHMSHKSPKKLEAEKSKNAVVCRNRKATHEYEILQDIECGVVLKGSEVKSIRNGKVSIDEAFARIRDGELWLVGCHIAEYPQANVQNHEPLRTRKLLLHKRELAKFAEKAEERGHTLIPLDLHFSEGKVKVKLAIARGRKLHDKREQLKKADADREIRQAMRRGNGE